jgi:hypothetical protein
MRAFRFALVAFLLGTAAAQAAPGILQANSANVRENDGSVTVTVQRRHGSTGVVTVDYATRSASAVAGRDFTPVSGTLTFQEGEVSKFVTIAILDNSTYDGNRTFFLGLSNATGGGTITTYPVGDVDLYDDEPPPNVSINDIRVTEGNSGTTNAEFTISITGVTRSIDIRILWVTNSYSAEEGSDFQSSGGTFWFTPADTQKTISVPVFGDLAIEEDEKFNVYVYGGASFTKQYGYCTIVNDDSLLSILINDVSIIEGSSGTTNAVMTLSATQPLSGVSINYSTVEGTAVAGRDFEHVSGSVVFAGETQKQITIPIIGDTDVEADEQFTVHLSSSDPSVTLQRSDITGTILNDDVAVGAHTLNVTFYPPSPTVFVGQTMNVRATVLPYEAPVTLQLAALGGTADVPASVEVGANGGTFTLTGLVPGAFAINAALPSQNSGATVQLFGEVTESPGTPLILQIAPAIGSIAGGTNVTLTGANFASNCTFAFGDRPAAKVVFANDTSVTATSPAHAAGAVDVTVTCGSDTFTLAKAFTFTAGRRRAVR